jgi:hypothetical protein
MVLLLLIRLLLTEKSFNTALLLIVGPTPPGELRAALLPTEFDP